jgi:hypothetical protein
MSEQIPPRPVTRAQVIGVLVSTLALFFVVAFATKSLEAYRLSIWRDRLSREIQEMVRQRDELREELRRRQSRAYAEEVLREAGQVAAGSVSVMVVGVTPRPAAMPAPQSAPEAAPAAAPATGPVSDQGLFRNPYWEAWKRLIGGFD